MKYKYYDNIIIITMTLVAAFCIYMLYGNKYRQKSNSNQLQIASIVEQIQTVKIKKDFFQSWMDVTQGEGLSQNDEIYTHGQSSAKINFLNGQQITLLENSLLRIKSINNENILSLNKGNLTTKLSTSSPKLDVLIHGKKYSFESSNANIQIEEGKTESKFLLLDGMAKLKISGEKKDLKTNQVLVQNNKTGDIKIQDIPFILKFPLNNHLQYYKNDKEIEFKWLYTKASISDSVKIIISKNLSFNDSLVSEDIKQNYFKYSFNQPGIYYWKLVSTDNIEGPTRSLILKEEFAPVIILDKNIVYHDPHKGAKVLIHWNSSDANNFILRIKNPQEEIKNIKLSQNNYELKDLLIGTYQFEVIVDDLNRPDAIWSTPNLLQVLDVKIINISNNGPDQIQKFVYNNQEINHLLTWNGPTSDVKYIITVLHNKFSKQYESTNTNFLINMKDAGEYEWKIHGESSSGILSNSIAGKIILKMPLVINSSPSEGAIIELEKPDQLVAFKWNQLEKNSQYEFELATESNFQNIIYSKETDSNSISTTLQKTGQYFWRVKIKDGKSIEYSRPVSVDIRPTPPLEKPVIEPAIKIKIKYIDNKSSLKSHLNNFLNFFIANASANDAIAIAEWDLPPNSRTKKYIVEIYEDQNLTKLLAKIESDKPHITWKNATPGNFYWRVSYQDYWGRQTDFSKLSTLATELEYLPPPPIPVKIAKKIIPIPLELVAPSHKNNILKFREDKAILSWIPLPEVKNYHLVVANDLDFKSKIFTKNTKNNELEITCKDLNNIEGDYYWRVETDKNNISKRRMFTVDCIARDISPLPAPLTLKNPIIDKAPHYLELALLPHKFNYTNRSAAYTAKINGIVSNSILGIYQRPVNWNFFQSYSPSIWFSRGKVFNNIVFTDYELNLKTYHKQSNFSWGPVVSFVKKTLYIESNLAIISENKSSPLIGIFIHKSIDSFLINAEIKVGGMLNYHTDLQYKINNQVFLGGFFDSTNLTKDNSKHSFGSIGLNLNYTFALLDIAK